MQNVVNKLNKYNAIFYIIRKQLTPESLKTLYLTLVQPYISYCNVIWGFSTKFLLNRLLKTQKKIIRTLTFSNRFEHTRGLFQRLDLLDYEKLNKFYSDFIVFKNFEYLNMYQNKYQTAQFFSRKSIET